MYTVCDSYMLSSIHAIIPVLAQYYCIPVYTRYFLGKYLSTKTKSMKDYTDGMNNLTHINRN